MRQLIVRILAVVQLLGTSIPALAQSEVESDPNANLTPVPRSSHDQSSSNTAGSPFGYAQICRAAISTVMGRPSASIGAEARGDTIFLSYVRADDGSVWEYRCRVEGSRILWASEPGGRWRDHPMDEKVTYRVTQESGVSILRISETYPGGTSSEKSFKVGDLK